MEKRLIAIALLLLAQTANAQGIYYCTKNGKKIMTDTPCSTHDAKHEKYVATVDMSPPNTVQMLTPQDYQRAQQSVLSEQTQRQHAAAEEQRLTRQREQQASAEAANKKARCLDLEQQKQNIVSQQRAPQSGSSHDWLRTQRQKIESLIYSQGCDTM